MPKPRRINTEQMSPEEKRSLESLMDKLNIKTNSGSHSQSPPALQYEIKELDTDGNLISVPIGEITKRTKLLETAFTNPEKVEGLVKVLSGQETILHVEKGKVVVDSKNLISPSAFEEGSQQESQFFDPDLREKLGKELLKYVYAGLAFFGKQQSDGWVTYQSDNYIYTKNDKQVKVVSKNTNLEVLNSHGFTSTATDQDISQLINMKIDLERFKQKIDPPTIPGLHQ